MLSASTVIHALQAIARESELVHERSHSLTTARSWMCATDRAAAINELSRSCNLLASRIDSLRKVVAVLDQGILAATTGTLAELGVRAQTLALLLLLDELNESMRDNPAAYSALFVGRFRTLDDVLSHVFTALAYIGQLWKPRTFRAKAAEPRPPGGNTRGMPQDAIERAHTAMTTLNTDSDMAHFLRAGAALVEQPRISRACIQFAVVTRTTVTRELDPSLFLAAALFDVDASRERGETPRLVN